MTRALLLCLIALPVLVGCAPVSGYEVNWATEQCKEHGGIEQMLGEYGVLSAMVRCVDGRRFFRKRDEA